MAAEAEEAHRGFLHRMRLGRPWMRLKAAAPSTERSRSQRQEPLDHERGGAARRSCVARALVRDADRHRHGPADDPELTVRHVSCKRQPRRV
jgi:diaminohydroxyphosphoribosylaminopyrimidine deaminase/5-amino-6-(5-phosphoribosylamino)uracil reductase